MVDFEGLSVDPKNRRDLKHVVVCASNIEQDDGKVYTK